MSEIGGERRFDAVHRFFFCSRSIAPSSTAEGAGTHTRACKGAYEGIRGWLTERTAGYEEARDEERVNLAVFLEYMASIGDSS